MPIPIFSAVSTKKYVGQLSTNKTSDGTDLPKRGLEHGGSLVLERHHLRFLDGALLQFQVVLAVVLVSRNGSHWRGHDDTAVPRDDVLRAGGVAAAPSTGPRGDGGCVRVLCGPILSPEREQHLLTAGFRRFRKWLSLGENCAACGAHGGAERWEAGGRESGAEIALT